LKALPPFDSIESWSENWDLDLYVINLHFAWSY
jgi:hypothetical protein